MQKPMEPYQNTPKKPSESSALELLMQIGKEAIKKTQKELSEQSETPKENASN